MRAAKKDRYKKFDPKEVEAKARALSALLLEKNIEFHSCAVCNNTAVEEEGDTCRQCEKAELAATDKRRGMFS